MKVLIDADEWYPVYEITENADFYKYAFDVPEEKVNEWKHAQEVFAKYQSEVCDLISQRKATSGRKVPS
jgi:hypothetical protein